MIARALEELHPGLTVELVEITTRGDRERGPLAPLGGKGLFTQELESGLLDGELDLAVHSLKDLPMHGPAELAVAAYPERADACDVLVSEDAESLDDLPPGSVLLTGSLRRQAQVLRHRPDLRVEGIRGNVETRLAKWARHERPAGVILAAAGLLRLGLDQGIPAHPLLVEQMLPAPGQGTLALQVRSGSAAEATCRALDHPPTAEAARAERRIVQAFGGSCVLPLAAFAEIAAGRVRLRALISTPDGRLVAEASTEGEDGESAASACIELLEERGARRILAEMSRE
jgi:hydroxymethylbilane synthase